MARAAYNPDDPNTWGQNPLDAPDDSVNPADAGLDKSVHTLTDTQTPVDGSGAQNSDASQPADASGTGSNDTTDSGGRVARKPTIPAGSPGPVIPGDVNGRWQPAPPPVPAPAPPPAPAAPAPVDIPDTLPTDPAATGFNQSIRDLLLGQLNGDLSQPETADSPDIAPAIAGHNLQSQRDEEAARDQLAEQAYAENGGSGLQSGGFQTSLEKNREASAANRANFVGNAVLSGAQNKRNTLTQMYNTAVQFGDTQTAQQIQSQIALLDAKLQEQGLNDNFAIANNNLGFNYADLISQMNRDALLGGMKG